LEPDSEFIEWGPRFVLRHCFDVFAQQVSNELTEIEAPNGSVAGSQSGLVFFHAALTQLPSLLSFAVISLVHAQGLQYSFAKEMLMFDNHRAQRGFVLHSDGATPAR